MTLLKDEKNIDWDKIFANYIFDKGLITKMFLRTLLN